jgi:hypothetical protein
MHAQDYRAEPQAQTTRRAAPLRTIHRWTALAFCAAVVVYLVSLIGGPPGPIATYAPVLPLVLLLASGAAMLLQHYRRAFLAGKRGGIGETRDDR